MFKHIRIIIISSQSGFVRKFNFVMVQGCTIVKDIKPPLLRRAFPDVFGKTNGV